MSFSTNTTAIGTTHVHGSVFALFWGSRQLNLFGGGGLRPELSIDPPPPRKPKPGLSSTGLDTFLLNIRVDKHAELRAAVHLASTLAAAGAAVVANLVPTLRVPDLDEGSIASAYEMDLEAPIRLGEHKCPGMLPRQASTLQRRRMYPVVRGKYEEPTWEICDLRGLFALDCRTDGRWDDIASRSGPCLPCLDSLSGKHAGRLNSWMKNAIHEKNSEPHYRQEPHALSQCLDEANDRGYVAQNALGQPREDLRKFRQRCKTYKALVFATADYHRAVVGR